MKWFEKTFSAIISFPHTFLFHFSISRRTVFSSFYIELSSVFSRLSYTSKTSFDLLEVVDEFALSKATPIELENFIEL